MVLTETWVCPHDPPDIRLVNRFKIIAIQNGPGPLSGAGRKAHQPFPVGGMDYFSNTTLRRSRIVPASRRST